MGLPHAPCVHSWLWQVFSGAAALKPLHLRRALIPDVEVSERVCGGRECPPYPSVSNRFGTQVPMQDDHGQGACLKLKLNVWMVHKRVKCVVHEPLGSSVLSNRAPKSLGRDSRKYYTEDEAAILSCESRRHRWGCKQPCVLSGKFPSGARVASYYEAQKVARLL